MQDIRNIAVIAHVDHGKTTLVDKMMLAGKLFRDGQDNSGEVLDANDLERERGITILSKNVSINWKGVKINILDTPGHSDFGGEVERVLNMADGCLLLVDAFEGPMPQTRFVLQKALQIGLKPIVVVNKVDKPNCRPEEVYEMVFDLMCDLNATEDQLDFPVVYGSAKNGWMGPDYNTPTDNIDYLLDKILEVIPAPRVLEGTPQMLITSLDYSSYTGRIAVGRVHRGTIRNGMNITICHRDGTQEKTKIKELHTSRVWATRRPMPSARAISVPSLAWSVLRLAIRFLISNTLSRFLLLPSTSRPCRCSSPSTTLPSSVARVSSALPAISTIACKSSLRRILPCVSSLLRVLQTSGLLVVVVFSISACLLRPCVVRATSCR